MLVLQVLFLSFIPGQRVIRVSNYVKLVFDMSSHSVLVSTCHTCESGLDGFHTEVYACLCYSTEWCGCPLQVGKLARLMTPWLILKSQFSLMVKHGPQSLIATPEEQLSPEVGQYFLPTKCSQLPSQLASGLARQTQLLVATCRRRRIGSSWPDQLASSQLTSPKPSTSPISQLQTVSVHSDLPLGSTSRRTSRSSLASSSCNYWQLAIYNRYHSFK